MSEKFKQWCIDVALRTVKTMAETAFGVITGSGVYMGDINWSMVLSATAVAGITCVLFNIKSIEPSSENVKKE